MQPSNTAPGVDPRGRCCLHVRVSGVRSREVRSDVIGVAPSFAISRSSRPCATPPLSASAPSVYSPREVIELLDSIEVDELRAMVTDRQLFVVAETDRLIVGSAGSARQTASTRLHAPDSQRAGLGTRLVACAESDFRNRTSAAEIHVASVIYARGFYEKLGYELATTRERTGSEPFWMKKRFDPRTLSGTRTANRVLTRATTIGQSI